MTNMNSGERGKPFTNREIGRMATAVKRRLSMRPCPDARMPHSWYIRRLREVFPDIPERRLRYHAATEIMRRLFPFSEKHCRGTPHAYWSGIAIPASRGRPRKKPRRDAEMLARKVNKRYLMYADKHGSIEHQWIVARMQTVLKDDLTPGEVVYKVKDIMGILYPDAYRVEEWGVRAYEKRDYWVGVSKIPRRSSRREREHRASQAAQVERLARELQARYESAPNYQVPGREILDVCTALYGRNPTRMMRRAMEMAFPEVRKGIQNYPRSSSWYKVWIGIRRKAPATALNRVSAPPTPSQPPDSGQNGIKTNRNLQLLSTFSK